MEAAASLDTMRVMKLIDEHRYRIGIELLEGIVAMLTELTRASKVAFTLGFTSRSTSRTLTERHCG